MFEFDPLTEEEINMSSLWSEGKYKGVIEKSIAKISKSSKKEMIELIVRLYNSEHEEKIIYCYLTRGFPRLLKHLCDALGYEDHYKSGKLDPSLFEGQNVDVSIKIQEDKTGQYGPRNIVYDFLTSLKKQTNAVDPGFDDDVPF